MRQRFLSWSPLVFLLGFASSLAGVALSALIFDRVALSGPAAAAAASAFVIASFGWLAVVVLQRADPQRVALFPVLLFVVSPLLLIGSLFFAVAVVPGFRIHGFWPYAGTIALLWPTKSSIERTGASPAELSLRQT